MKNSDYIKSLVSNEQLSPHHHFTAAFHIAKVEGRVFWFGNLHFKLDKETIEKQARAATPHIPLIFHWSRNMAELRPENTHPGYAMVECPDLASAALAKAALNDFRFSPGRGFKARAAKTAPVGRPPRDTITPSITASSVSFVPPPFPVSQLIEQPNTFADAFVPPHGSGSAKRSASPQASVCFLPSGLLDDSD
ncbi:hypothetical protein B0T16DRAFT_460294 [Cercophora newfieldiana]|uniref:RRM domain-containing protein n=1 Tax=Cercophora newfieldiana TaxID=92897 RepID=A0AA39Y1E4_9PEZI|nr:hypothetical protein B0T16DRAFT_460294 [Cercophora newfieldiana]